MKPKIKEIYDNVKDKAHAYTKKELEGLIIVDGFDKRIAKKVIKELVKNKVNFKDTKPEVKDKEKILKELEQTVSSKKEEKNKEKETKPKKSKKFNIGTFFKKIYFFFEDKYYWLIDKISKVIPINKLTDKIDKKFPSFILFLLFIILLVWLIFFSGINLSLIPTTGSTIEVTVTDTTGSMLSEIPVVLLINDIEIDTQTTNVFGTLIFKEQKLKKKDNIELFVSKEPYNTVSKKITTIKKYMTVDVILDINTQKQIYNSPERTREIIFKENDIKLATSTLIINLKCSNTNKTPNPSQTTTNTGMISVLQPAGCETLRIDVTSEQYKPVQNQEVPENNTIHLTLKAQANVGKLEIFVKDLKENSINSANISLFRVDETQTTVNSSNLPIKTGVTDYYGRFVFENLSPGKYTLATNKDGYISLQRDEEYQITINNTTTANLTLLSIEDLENINCSDPLMAQFCKNNCLDCNNLLLQNYYTKDSSGNLIKTGNNCCQIGKLGYINVTLIDINNDTTREIKGDIELFKKNIGKDGYTRIDRKFDTNFANFSVISGTYKIYVRNTEDYGYYAPDPVDVNTIDKNVIIPLEYSSTLNTGAINVNVKRSGYNRVANVYIFNANQLDSPIKEGITNSNGDINFSMLRANRDYFAFAVENNYQGSSSTNRLDSNETLQLNVDLKDQAKILNLKTNVREYNISFYSLANIKITEYTVSSASDTNKEYVFNCSQNEIYAVITAENKATYQTDVITLIPGQKTYYAVNLNPSKTTATADIQFLGLYDESGANKINSITINEYRNKTLKLKYKFNTVKKENRELSYAFIRAGKFLTLASDFLEINTIFAPGSTLSYGCNYHGDLENWNEDYFVTNYSLDTTQNNCTNQTGYKWSKINFTQTEAEEIEFSVNIKFKNNLTKLEDYAIYYKALTKTNNEDYAFSPIHNNSWKECSIKPEGYFYAPSKIYQLEFLNNNYNLLTNIYDWNNTQGLEILPEGNTYELKINHNYLYYQNFLYLDPTHSITNKEINAYSTNTLSKLIYSSYIFNTKNKRTSKTEINSPEYTINNLSLVFGDEFDHNSIILIKNFFEPNAKIDTKLLGISDLNPYSKNVLAYYDDSNIFIEILTNDYDELNDVYIGDNNITFIVKDKYNTPIPNINIKYQLQTTEQTLGVTNNRGLLEDKNISFTLDKLGWNIYFKFTDFPISYGLPNNTITLKKTIKPGYKLTHENGQTITVSNPLVYDVGKYQINGISKITTAMKNYFLVKTSSQIPIVNILVSGNLRNIINIEDTNKYLHEKNTIPTTIPDQNKLIETELHLNQLPTNTSEVIGNYNNLLNIGTFDNQQIIFDLNANIKINKKFDVNLTIQTENLNKPGKTISDSMPYIELIKDINPVVDYNYIVTNNSTTPITIDLNSIKDGALSKLDIIYPGSVTIPANSSKRINIKYQLQNNSNSVLQEKDVNIIFNYKINNLEFIEIYPQKIKIFTSSDLYTIKKNSIAPPWTHSLSCTKTNCTDAISTQIENKTKTYDLLLNAISFVDTDNNFTINTTLPQDINTTQQKILSLNLAGSYNGLTEGYSNQIGNLSFTKNKILNLKLKIQNTNLEIDKNIFLTLKTAVMKQTNNELLEEQGLFGNFCLGFGSSSAININNFDIIGICEIDNYDNCKSGESTKSKIKYNWIYNDVWDTECIDNNLNDYNTNKTHCDSSQMLFSVFRLIENGYFSQANNYSTYIYLMADGVSEDLLKDLTEYKELFGDTIYDNPNDIFTIEKIEEGKFTINKKEIINNSPKYTTKPGKYKLSINSNFKKEVESELHISLELVREMPYSMRNLLYYLPIDGPLGIDDINKETKRNGYGASIIGNESSLPIQITGSNYSNDIIIYNSNDDFNSFIKVIANNNNLATSPNSLYNTINSEGKLIDIKLDAINTDQSMLLTINYSPSYPMPLYVAVANSNLTGLNYRLKKSEQNYNLLNQTLIKWEDYELSNKILKDNSFFTENSLYFKSQVMSSTFKTVYGNKTQNKLLKTLIYWPIYDFVNFNNIYITLEDQDLENHPNTKIYSLSNINNLGSKRTGTFSTLSKVENLDIKTVLDVFNMVYEDDAKVCMESGLTSVIVRWKKSEIDFTDDQITSIIENFNNIEDTSSEQTETQTTGSDLK